MPILNATKFEFLVLQSKQLYPKRFNAMGVKELSENIMQIVTPSFYFGKIEKPNPETVYHLAGYLKEAFPMLMVGDIHALMSLSNRKMINKIDRINIETFSIILPKYEAILLDLILRMNELAKS